MAGKVNAIIVGSGAAGGVVAKELSQAGLSVLLLEKGRWWTDQDAVHDELRGSGGIPQQVTHLEELEKNPRTFRYDASEAPTTGTVGFNAFGVGGGTVWYGGAAWRFHEEHFQMRTKYGQPAGTSLEDWPISYADLEPYYEKAEYELGVSGLTGPGEDPFGPPRKKPYPVKPLPLNPQGELFQTTARKIGLHPFPPPFAIITEEYKGRMGCIRCPQCIGMICEVNAKSSTAVTVIPEALDTKNCTLKTKCMADRIITDGQGKIRGVTYFDDTRGTHEFQEADIVIVSCNALESARLLLNSACRLFPKGLANSSGQVGRNIMSHIGANSYGIFEKELPHDEGPGPSIAVNDWAVGRLAGGHIYNFYVHWPIAFATSRVPPSVPRWGRAHKQYMAKYFRRFMQLNSDCSDLPVESNYAEIDPALRDAWGIPALRITRKFHPLDIEGSNFVAARQREILKEAGAIEVWSAPTGRGAIGQHQCGSCRMGDDPKKSVLNRYCRTHDHNNLFVVDTSAFVSFPGHNPSLTAQALAYWACEYIRKQWRGGGLRA